MQYLSVKLLLRLSAALVQEATVLLCSFSLSFDDLQTCGLVLGFVLLEETLAHLRQVALVQLADAQAQVAIRNFFKEVVTTLVIVVNRVDRAHLLDSRVLHDSPNRSHICGISANVRVDPGIVSTLRANSLRVRFWATRSHLVVRLRHVDLLNVPHRENSHLVLVENAEHLD